MKYDSVPNKCNTTVTHPTIAQGQLVFVLQDFIVNIGRPLCRTLSIWWNEKYHDGHDCKDISDLISGTKQDLV